LSPFRTRPPQRAPATAAAGGRPTFTRLGQGGAGGPAAATNVRPAMTDEQETLQGGGRLLAGTEHDLRGAAPDPVSSEATETGDAADGDAPGTDQPAGGPPAGRRHLKRRRHHVVPWLVIIVFAVGIAAVVRIFFVQTFFVPSISMYPTLQEGDRMLVLKEGYTIQRGAVLVFRHPPLDTRCGPGDDDLVKRVIGLPGETIWSSGNTVYIDGKPLAEPWLPRNDPMGPTSITKQTIPPNDYFMMGDNRSESCDSRYWGPLPRSLVVGRVFLVIWRHGHPVFDVI